MSTDGEGAISSEPSESALAYCLPFLLYLAGMSLASTSEARFPIVYAAVTLAVAVACCWSWRRVRMTTDGRFILPGVLGLGGAALWIGICHLELESHLAAYLPHWLRGQQRLGFNPFVELPSAWIVPFIAVRLVGISMLVPIAEELFWRAFLLRWLDGDDWQQYPLGHYSPRSFAVVTILFTLAHPEWFAAATYCTLLNLYFGKTRDIGHCMVIHAMSNLGLSIYILTTGNWHLW